MDAVIRAYDAQIDSVEKSDRSLVARINTAGVDRYKTVIDPKGASLENYRKNPLVLWEHGKDSRRFTDPIGRNLWVRSDGGERPRSLLARTRFLEDDFSQQRWEWYRDGVLNAFSVNILPADASPPTKDEIRSRPEWEPAQTIYRKWDLAEYSGTSIPGNADALVADRAGKLMDLVTRNLITLPDEVKAVVEARAVRTISTVDLTKGPSIEPLDPPEPILRYIKHEGDKWVVYSEAGKKLGEFDSEAEAKKRLAEIEYFKHKDKGRTFGQLHLELVTAIRTWADRKEADAQAYVDLWTHGRV